MPRLQCESQSALKTRAPLLAAASRYRPKQHSGYESNNPNDKRCDREVRGLGIYLRERFPLPLVAMLAAAFALGSVGLFRTDVNGGVPLEGWRTAAADWPTPILLLLLFVLYLALLLRYRVTDEWKDFTHDSAVYPDRPVQRGAVSPRTLLTLGLVATVAELSCVGFLGGWLGLVLYVPIVLYSLLTAVEFFARDWMSRHFTASFLIHEFLYLPFFAWVAAVLGAQFSAATVAGVFALAFLFVSIEVARKFRPRFDPSGAMVSDTYGAVWGRSIALTVLVLLMLVSGMLAILAGAAPLALCVSAVLVALLLVRRASDSWVAVIAAAHLPLLTLVVFL